MSDFYLLNYIIMQITVNKLLKFCTAQVHKGNGNKKVRISDDVEGNWYHELFYGFTDNPTDIKALDDVGTISYITHDKYDDVVILG